VVTLKRRFKGKEDEVIEYIKNWGYFWASDEYKCTWESLKKWATEYTGNENLGVYPRFSSLGGSGNNNPFNDVSTAIRNRLAKDKKYISELHAQLEEERLKNQLLTKMLYKNYGQQLLALKELVEG